MRTKFFKYLIYLVLITVSVSILSDCAINSQTKPNVSIISENYIPPKLIKDNKNFLAAQKILTDISNKNSLLAMELGKLPELQDGISHNDKEALLELTKIYHENQEKFDQVFEEMYKVGLPNVRKYNSPLQALFWLFEDNKVNAINVVRDSYYLQNLLIHAWDFPDKRWKKFSSVVDRLNAPELLDFYITNNFSYQLGRQQTPQDTFHYKSGQCVSLAVFGEYILKKAGYKTFIRMVKWGVPAFPNNAHAGAGVIVQDSSYLLVVDFGRMGNRMSGPYKNIQELDLRLSRGQKIIDRMWGYTYRWD